jgi:thiosulfate/3-mercaptopyruvate sulfurtransferase
VYGEPQSAGWLFFALEYLGHERISLLDGSLAKWRAEARPVAPASRPTARGTFKPSLRTALRATAADVQAEMAAKSAVLIDARTMQEYDRGRIPGARLLSWQDVYADPKRQVFKTSQEVAALLAGAGATQGRRVIAYCQIGLRSSVLYFAARYAGFASSNYVGSWSDWAGRGLPSEAVPQK